MVGGFVYVCVCMRVVDGCPACFAPPNHPTPQKQSTASLHQDCGKQPDPPPRAKAGEQPLAGTIAGRAGTGGAGWGKQQQLRAEQKLGQQQGECTCELDRKRRETSCVCVSGNDKAATKPNQRKQTRVNKPNHPSHSCSVQLLASSSRREKKTSGWLSP